MSENLPAISESGILKPRNLPEAIEQAKIYVQSGQLPERYKTASSVLVAMQFALELGLRPLTALRQIAVVKGTPSVFGDLPLSMVYASGKMESIKEAWLDKNGQEITFANKNLLEAPFAAVCIVRRKGDPEPLESFFTMQDAVQAGIANGPTWKAYPKRMLRYRARSQALKDKFPDVLNGISIAEYDQHIVLEDLSDAPQSTRPEPKAEAPEPAPNSLASKLKKKIESPEVIDIQIE